MNFKQKIYFFSQTKTDGDQSMPEILGGKGANLAEMCKLGLPVPPGFTLATRLCNDFLKNKKLSLSLKKNIKKHVKKTEGVVGASFGGKNPLLLSVRSGAPVSMPGMMETVLNVGLTSKTIPHLVVRSGSERFAYDSYRRLIMMYADVVMEKALGLNKSNTEVRIKMERLLKEMKKKKKYKDDSSVSAKHWKELSFKYLALIKKDFGVEFPDDPYSQLFGAIEAVFSSWNGKRAQEYRAFENIPDAMGTAVSVQAMVFGNLGEGCGTGVAFTRNPSTGENKFYGEWLQNAQGEDVVAGIRTPHPILAESGLKNSLEKTMPAAFLELDRTRKQLEKHFDDMQDIEFTIQDHKLWMLQTRTGKRTGIAAVKIATDMVGERLISKKTALSRVRPNQIYESLLKNIEPDSLIGAKALGTGLPAGPGASCGAVVFSAEKAEELGRAGKSVILVREETSPEDIRGMHYSDGILTSRGGLTSHAALVARGWGKSCVVGCQTLHINKNMLSGSVGDTKIKEGDWITLSGSTGEIFKGRLPLFQNPLSRSGPLNELLSWADHTRKLKIRTNADTPEDCKKALGFGAEGIGLCRTEHMFFDEKRVRGFRKMILSDDKKSRVSHLANLLPFQTKDFYNILKVMESKPVTVRLLDPPLHEFITIQDKEVELLALDLKQTKSSVLARIEFLKESNPMLGHRGCRLGISYPEITEMQARALLGAGMKLKKEGFNPNIEIMIPLVSHINEFVNQKNVVDGVYKELLGARGVSLKYRVGTMIEVPRACLIAEEIAQHADFFSFGTNDLTQTTFGFSRDDTGSFFESYFESNILPGDPFEKIDKDGVGRLMSIAVSGGRKTKKTISIGICGEHGGEPDSIRFCSELGLNYVSCSPFRIPIARLAAAQVEL
ncbi:MAG: pyruvate, phosphate dikinase [bacterium TMED217]|nr:MAG: pyruvate, phosphate dikinase [bacterium TMED217]|tara:strand:+ start:7789 stop:10467 length:2679 start_codon:yes stop_codon:yes gene_type:complete